MKLSEAMAFLVSQFNDKFPDVETWNAVYLKIASLHEGASAPIVIQLKLQPVVPVDGPSVECVVESVLPHPFTSQQPEPDRKVAWREFL